jgi:RNA polymerase sigma-70 factor, ECF subfamily
VHTVVGDSHDRDDLLDGRSRARWSRGCALARLGLILRREQVNGEPGALVVDREGRLISVMILDAAEGQIQGVSAIANPDKLRHLGPLGDPGALLPERS